MPKALETLKVTEGDRVEIVFTSDAAMELHLHGIDKTVRLTPGAPVTLAFTANHAGRFPMESHVGKRHVSVLYIEVHPQ
ncbi:MAG: hypothetical protein VW268_12150 [Rhodospirillaceae bacterium]